MSCSYYKDRGGMFSFQPYCYKKEDYVNTDMFDKYCKGYYYSDCPIYKGGSDSSDGCYLTSACVYAKGLPDDCHELTVLRGYRDGWLRTAPEGEALIEQYYKEAPRIVSNINERSDQKSIYEKIYEEVVCPCVEYIENNEMKEALQLYKNMVLDLKKKYW